MRDLVAPDVLTGLKDFQRTTVDYVFDRLYADTGSRRFLVADEVGLGKTMIAKGVVAKAIDHLRARKVERIDVVYICSNGDIARQNINRLKVGDEDHVPIVSRLTMLPRTLSKLKSSKSGVNFISFTPSTSFDVHDGLGQIHERALLYYLLSEAWTLDPTKAPMKVFQGHASADRFEHEVSRLEAEQVPGHPRRLDDETVSAFNKALRAHVDRPGEPTLKARFADLCASFRRAVGKVDGDVARERYRFIGDLRGVLAKSCVEALEPDLIILDEFQRFSHLLEGEDDACKLARALFTYPDVRVLMLSATPYKMYTTSSEANGEDHYRDFARTLRFLENDTAVAGASLDIAVGAYREALLQIGEPAAEGKLVQARSALETKLRGVMVRTERLASTADRNGMLAEVVAEGVAVRAEDLKHYLALQKVADAVDGDATLELWKSAPYVLNFANDGYKLGRKLNEIAKDGEARQQLAKFLAPTPEVMFPWSQAEKYGEIDSGNARMRRLIGDVVDNGAYRMLWIPPSLPYYKLGGVYAEPALASFTKRLIFSSWRMVPRTIASMVSYEAERRMVASDPSAQNTVEARKRKRGLLRFTVSDGRLTGMPVLALLYPSLSLARACDPAILLGERARERNDSSTSPLNSITLDEVLILAQERIELSLRRLESPDSGPVDERWYWAAPLLLDRLLEPIATRAWFEQENLAAAWAGDEDDEDAAATAAAEEDAGVRRSNRPPPEEGDSWERHVATARAFALAGQGAQVVGEPMGRMPEDLVAVLAELAVAGPAVAMFRAFDRVVNGESKLTPEQRLQLRNGAGQTAWSFRSLFNQVEVMTMLRGLRAGEDLPYWRIVLDYCAKGCLPAVLDEYVHVLRDHLGLMSGSVGARVREITKEICTAVELRTSRVQLEHYGLSDSGRTLRVETKNLRTHYALRFADEKNDEGEVVTRSDQIRKAFNSPFWPFVLATTSVGQEGLDFHTFCHAVVHWNLPSNPVDLEQREGRVHRYKGHAVRRNVASLHGWTALQSEEDRDFWETMFRTARDAAQASGASEIVPYWVYPVEGGAKIERHIFSLPLSREVGHAANLRSSLSLYRMVFGQPRQEDMVRFLASRVPANELERLVREAKIDLAPTP